MSSAASKAPVASQEPSQETQEAINRVAIGIYACGFIPARQDQYRPREGTLIRQLWQSKKLTLRAQRGWAHFTADLYAAAGRSGPVCGGYGESSGARNGSDFKVPLAGVNTEYRRLEKLIRSLDRQEAVLLKDLIADELRRNGELKLDLIGFHINGYSGQDQANAAGVANITALLSRIAGFYNL